MNHCRKHKKQMGFTLVEMVLYVAMLAVFSVFIMRGVLLMSDAFVDFRLTRDINNSAVTIMERLTREIRDAQSVDLSESSFGAHPGTLTLNTLDEVGVDTTIEFYIDSGRIKVREGGADVGYLSSQNVFVDLLVFDFVSNTNTSAITIRMQLSSSKKPLERQKTFYSTVVLRGSY